MMILLDLKPSNLRTMSTSNEFLLEQVEMSQKTKHYYIKTLNE